MSEQSGQIERHRSVKYQIKEYAVGEADFVITPQAGGRGFDVTGFCPGCGARINTSWSFGVGGSKGPFRRHPPASPQPGPRTLCCECGHAHADRPNNAIYLGCGALWQVEFRP